MKSPNQKKKNKRYGCLSISSGCLVFALLFPFCTWLFGWLSFAFFGSLPSTLTNGILGFVCLFGGVFGIPIASGIFAGWIVQTARNRWVSRQEREDL